MLSLSHKLLEIERLDTRLDLESGDNTGYTALLLPMTIESSSIFPVSGWFEKLQALSSTCLTLLYIVTFAPSTSSSRFTIQ